MHIIKETKAISTLLAILLIIVSAIIGALLSYMWTIAPFYHEPEDTVDLIVTDANFPVDHATYFDVTVMNPSHSVSGTNITDIYLTADGFNRSSVKDTVPELPIVLDKGTSKTINCSLEWGEMAGKMVTVHVLTVNNTEAALAVITKPVTLEVNTFFDASASIEQFNISVANGNSAINLTVSGVLFDYNSVKKNLSLTLPEVIPANQSRMFTCFVNWRDHIKPIVQVETLEGYTAETRSDAYATVSLQTSQVAFNETNTNEIAVTLFNSPDSITSVNVTSITLAHGSTTEVISWNLSNPTLPRVIDRNQTVTFVCAWNWTDRGYRNMDVTVTAHTKQGFTSELRTVRTPLAVAGKINEVRFDLDDTGVFVVNMTNMPYSLESMNVTGIDLNQTPANISATLVVPSAEATVTCMFNWSSLIGENVTVRAHISYDSNESLLTYTMKLPYLKITNASFLNLYPGNPYVNVTVRNSEFSKINATITQMHAKSGNTTVPIAVSMGQEVAMGSEIGVLCPWDWNPYIGQDITIIVQTADGLQVSATFRVE